ncbi:MAG: adenylate/guanylate cyclase domain-containing protein [Kiloniellales bacterium]
MQRRLAAILAADVVGYSRLMGLDEAGTLQRLKALLAELIGPTIEAHKGRIVKLMGDGVLAEFPSVVEAVTCGLDIQKATDARDPDLADGQRMRLRIGINLGDVIIEGDDIYGDGVNIAARLETLAPAGGICISSLVYESLGSRIEANFSDAGRHQVKNIAKPIQVFRWPPALAAETEREELVPKEVLRAQTIAVQAFGNLSKDAELGFFCEGVGEDIATAIGSIRQLTVVNEATAETARGSHHFILSGQARRGGNRIRVSARLVNSETGVQVWAERFDRDGDDLFQAQDDIARKIVIAVHSVLGAGSYTNRWQWGTDDFEAWQTMARGFREFQIFSPDSMQRAADEFEVALSIDPDYLAPLMAGAYCYGHLAWIAEGEEAEALISRAEEAARRAMEIAPKDVRPYAALRAIEFARGRADAGVAAAEVALKMAPSDSYCRATLAFALTSASRPEDALAQMAKAAREIPNPPGWLAQSRIHCLFMLGRESEAYRSAKETLSRLPDLYSAPVMCAALAAELGKTGEAETQRQAVLGSDPSFSRRLFVDWQGLSDAGYRERLLAALAKAGFPA